MDGLRTFELKVGIFVLIGIVMLFIIVFSIGDVNLMRSGYHINVIFVLRAGRKTDPAHVERVRVVIDKRGIVRLEEA